MCKNADKKLWCVIMYIPNQYETPEICDKSLLDNVEMLRFIPYCYKIQ